MTSRKNDALNPEAASRRRFIRQSAAASLLTLGAVGAPAIVRGRNLNDKLNLAIIGAGGRGGDVFWRHCRCVALMQKGGVAQVMGPVDGRVQRGKVQDGNRLAVQPHSACNKPVEGLGSRCAASTGTS